MVKNRVSIPAYQVAYLLQVGQQIGTDDLTKVVETVVNDHRRGCIPQGVTLPAPTVQEIEQPSLSTTYTPPEEFDPEDYLEGVEASLVFG